MKKNLDEIILEKFKEFMESESYDVLSKTDGSIRTYKSRFDGGKLTAKAALTCLLKLGYIRSIKFKKIK